MAYSFPTEVSNLDKDRIRDGVGEGKAISLITYVLGNRGEAKLKWMLDAVLASKGRLDLVDLFYTTSKELIANSTKAAIKRMIFQEMRLDIRKPRDYRKGMDQFKYYLNEQKFPVYRERMKEKNFFIKITVRHSVDWVYLYVINNFSLIPSEVERVAEKFKNAKKFDNLFEFFLAHGDSTEGAGMGITMVEILLTQSGFDRHNFVILSSPIAHVTMARVGVPLTQLAMDQPIPTKQLIYGDLTLGEIKGVFY